MYLAVENMNSVCSWDWQKGGGILQGMLCDPI